MKKIEHYLTKMITEILMPEDTEIVKNINFTAIKKNMIAILSTTRNSRKPKIPKVDSSHTCLEKNLEKDEN